MNKLRVGMIVPSLNTIAEDDFRMFCPADVAYHVHRVRLRKENGRVPMEGLVRAYLEALDDATYLQDMSPAAIAFNCTGASVAYGVDGDVRLAEKMTAKLGIPATNTMVAIKQALRAVGAEQVLHLCPFTDEFSKIERDSLLASGVTIHQTVSLELTDAKVAAKMEPEQIVETVKQKLDGSTKAILLSCANVRAFEAADALEHELGMPVITSNQAMLWAVLKAAGWSGELRGAGRLFRS